MGIKQKINKNNRWKFKNAWILNNTFLNNSHDKEVSK